MTRPEMIRELLNMSSALEAEGRDMAALACSQAAAQLMLVNTINPTSDMTPTVTAAQSQLDRDFNNIISIAFGRRHPSGKVPDGTDPTC